MHYKPRSRLTYANVMATAAVFIALGGTSVATHETIFSDDIVDGQVMRRDLATGAVANTKILDGGIATSKLQGNSVTTSRIAPGAVTNLRLADNAVTASKVSDGSLGTTEFSSSIPAAHVLHSTTQSIADSTNTTLAFDTEQYDTANTHDNSTNNSRLIAPVTGIYALNAFVQWQPGAGSAGTRVVTISKNGGPRLGANGGFAVTGGGSESTTVTPIVRLEAGEYVEAIVYQTSGGSVDVNASDAELSMTWLAPGP